MEQDHFSSDIPSEPFKTTAFSHARFAYLNVIAIFLAYQLAGGLLSYITQLMHLGKESALLQGIGQIVFMLIPTLILMQYSPLKRSTLLRLDGDVLPSQWILGVMGILAIQLFASGISTVQEVLIPEALHSQYVRLRESIDSVYTTLLSGSTPIDALRALLIGAVIPAISEESLFRGLMQRSLEEVYTPVKAISITAILFGLLHFNPIEVVPLILIGAYLGFLSYYTQTLALPIVVHFFNNALAIVGLYVTKNTPPSEMSISQALVLTIVGLFLLLLILQFFLKTPRVLPVKAVSPDSTTMLHPPEE